MDDDLPRTPKGYQKLLAAEVYLKDDELIVLGDPPTDDEEAELHNCDYMGCGVQHVLCRAIVAIGRTDGKKTRIETLQARVGEGNASLIAAGQDVRRLEARVEELKKVAHAAERYCDSTENKYEDDDPRGNQGLMYNRLKFALGPIQALRCCDNAKDK